ncbi:MAG: response regulator [Myxococcota bacterium]
MGSDSKQRKIDTALNAARQRHAPGVASGRPLPRSESPGVLVVEADPDLQWRLARMLTVQGNRVVGTGSGDGALALVEQWPVDLVLVGEDLPGMNGLEVARRMSRDYPQIPVVLMTANEDQAVQREAFLAGVLGCLRKPFQFDALTELLESLASPLADPTLILDPALLAGPAE